MAVGYRTRVSHARVTQEIARLSVNGWTVSNDVKIADESIRPGDPVRAPVTTGAQFSLYKAPQVLNNAPAVWQYIQAFQAWDHVSVVFNLSELQPYNGVDDFESKALAVHRIPQENAYQYEALIRDHTGRLPALVPVTTGRRAESGGRTEVPHSGPAPIPTLALMLILMGVGIGGGVIMYAWVAKRAGQRAGTRDARL